MGRVNSSYVSDHMAWMNDLMEKNPHWRAEQKAGRALWWDKKQTTDETAAHAASRVAQKPYPYDVNFYGDHGE